VTKRPERMLGEIAKGSRPSASRVLATATSRALARLVSDSVMPVASAAAKSTTETPK
jgi:hypothetical protein